MIITTLGFAVLFHALCRFVSSKTSGLSISHFLHHTHAWLK
jgi:hypothetical protein